MYKNLTKGRIQKIMLTLVCLILFNFVAPMYKVKAVSKDDVAGWMLTPVVCIFTWSFDGLMWILQSSMIGFDNTCDIYQDKANLNDIKKMYPEMAIKGSSDITVNPEDFTGDYKIPVILYTPEAIFSNKIAALNINFFKSSEDTKGQIGTSSMKYLKDVVSNWYKSLRYLAIVGLLSVLVYVGIRMIISSTAPEKSKYKQMLIDWIVAMCLLFIMHFIMAGIMTIIDSITDMVASSNNGIGVNFTNGDQSFTTSLTGVFRLQIENTAATKRFAYLLLYMVVVGYTLYFTIIYLKRLLYITFLTIIAPLVALTYPLDKVGDGKSQAFDMWLKEYVFNALMQPFHLLLYTVLVGSAMNLVTTNFIYAVVAIGFMVPAEKFLRKMFGFEKASTAGNLGSFAGGALASQLINRIGKKGSSGKVDKSDKSDKDNIWTPNTSGIEDFADTDGISSGAESSNSQNVAENQNSNSQQLPNDNVNEQLSVAGLENNTQNSNIDQNPNPNSNSNSDSYSDPNLNWSSNSNLASGSSSSARRYSRPRPSIKSGIKNLGKSVGKSALKKGKTILKNSPKRILGGLAGAGLGALGLAAGVASGDPSKAFQLGLAGYTAGSSQGQKLGEGVISSGKNALSTYREGAYGVEESYKRKQQKEFMKDDTKRDYIAQEFDLRKKSDIDKKMEQAAILNSHGINNMKDLTKAMKEQDKINSKIDNMDGLNIDERLDRKDLATRQLAYAQKEASKYSRADFDDPKKYANMVNRYKSKLKEKGITDDAVALKNATEITKMMKKFN